MTISPVNDVWIRIDADDSILRELSEYFTFEIPNAHFMPAARKGWDRKIRLFKLRTHYLYRGLLPRVLEFAQQKDYEIINRVPTTTSIFADTTNVINNMKLTLPLRDYQRAALEVMLHHHRGIIVSPTGSGKSYVIYHATQLIMQHIMNAGEQTPGAFLIIVPTLGLVSQMASDFLSYGCDPRYIQTIQGGKTTDVEAPIVISTWQSIYEQNKHWFTQFDGVIVDEVHLAKSKSLAGIMEKCENVSWRFGFTGTMDKTECHRLILEGLFGSVTKVATTNELVKQKHLAKPRVIVCVLEYPEAVRKQMRHKDYNEEIDFLVSSGPRNKFLALLCREQKHNTLLLFQLVAKHGAALFTRIKNLISPAGPDSPRDVWYIDGNQDASIREAIRRKMTESDNDVLIASYGTTQLGVNIPNLRTLVLAHPSKSVIRVLQSIGRILRLSEGKTNATVIDVVDDLRIGKYRNFAWKHAEERMAYYAAEKFPVTLKKVPLSMFAAAPVTRQTTNGPKVDTMAGSTT